MAQDTAEPETALSPALRDQAGHLTHDFVDAVEAAIAAGETRTRTSVTSQRPQRCASTNSATAA